MTLFEEYQNQNEWRDWSKYIKELPLNENQTVLDLGCSIGSVSNILSDSVKKVFGFDLDQDLLSFAKENSKSNTCFLQKNLLDIDFANFQPFDGIWSSFTLSYIKNPQSYINSIFEYIAYNGWISLVDISCFISGNMNPMSKYFDVVKDFEMSSYKNGKYDFDIGNKLEQLLTNSGFKIILKNSNVFDGELNFNGRASEKILYNWQARLDRMINLKTSLKSDYEDFKDDDQVRILNCNHYFHIKCISDWLLNNNNCPTCRKNVLTPV